MLGLMTSSAKIERLGEIGRGGFCVVHEARVRKRDGTYRDELIAVKSLREDTVADPEVVARFQREARLMDDVLSHPNIVGVIARNLSAAIPWFAMKKADTNLGDEIEAGKWQDESWAIEKYRQILEGMAYAHDKGVIHRDLKPENALLFGDVVQISDFGLGKHLVGGTVGLTKTATWSGTEPYMAPEQFTAMKDTGPEADVFSLGKLAIVALTGVVPVVGQPDVSVLPEKYRYFVQRCCSTRLENRFANAREALEAFDRITRGSELSETSEEAVERLAKEWFETEEGSDEERAKVREIDEHLRTNADDEAMFTRAVPRLPQDMLDQYMDEFPEDFGHMLAVYDDHVSGGLPFEYCDVVTDFYERVFRRSSDVKLRELIIRRLYVMGWSHHRFHVRTRLLTLLGEFRDPSTVAIALDVIKQDPQAADFHAERVASFNVPGVVRKALESARAP